MYTVEELIKALEGIPKDYIVAIHIGDTTGIVDTVGIHPTAHIVDLFAE